MTEEQKKQVAAFRFGVICELVNGARLNPGEQARLIREKCARRWQIPHSELAAQPDPGAGEVQVPDFTPGPSVNRG